MRHKKSSIIRLGVFVVLSLIIFTFGVYKIGNQQNIFGSTFTISTIVNNANGLQIGNNVRYAGMDVGTVSKIIFLNVSTLQIDMSLKDHLIGIIRKNAVTNISSDGLVGNMVVNISPRKGEGLPIAEGDILESIPRTETQAMLNTLEQSADNIAVLTKNLVEISEKINTGTGSISMLLNEAKVSTDINTILNNLTKTTSSLSTLSQQVEKDLSHVKNGKGLIGYLLKDSSFETHINHLALSLDSLINDRTAEMMINLQATSQTLSNTATSLDSKISNLALDQGIAGALLNDTLMLSDLKQSLKNLEKGTDGFNQNMEALKRNFLFKKYFKKLEKQKEKEAKKSYLTM